MKEEYTSRRAKIKDSLLNDSMIILLSGSEIRKSADAEYPYSYDKNFYYLTGITQANSGLIIVKKGQEINEYLFVEKYDALKEAWTGIRLKKEEAENISGIKEVLEIEDFNKTVHKLIRSGIKTIFLDDDSAANYGNFKTYKSVLTYKRNLKKVHNDLNILSISNEFIRLRMVKSSYEVEQLKLAIENTKNALLEVLKNLKGGMYEYEIARLFEYQITADKDAKTSFNTIAASGVNATILHYPNPCSLMKDGDLLLLDLGAMHNGYCADISRTYPISGQYNEMQKNIYNLVLECNKYIISLVKPGVTISFLQQETISFLAKGLLELEVIKEESEISKYYFHNISHHLGLDTHDISFRNLPLEEGNVITVEPGLYIKQLNIGVRVEDDVLVVRDGCQCLSKDIIKEIDDIENEMRK